MEKNTKALVIAPSEFDKVMDKFLNALKEKKIVESFIINKSERLITVNFNPEAEIPETKEDVITKGLFRNAESILKNLGYEDVELKTITLPMYSTQEDGDKVIVNY